MKMRASTRFLRSVHGAVAAGAVAVASLAGSTAAGPQNPVVVHGNVVFAQNGNFYLITASNGSVINYSSFNIGPNQTVQFLQPNEFSRVLNHITGGMPTTIDGNLLANGFVFFANPAGVIFGNNAVVNVGGIYAAAAEIDPDVFHAAATLNPNGMGQYPFTNVSGDVIVETGANLMAVHAAHLIGQRIVNHGTIRVAGDGGIITMTANNGDVMVSEIGGNYFVSMAGGGPAIGGVGIDNTGTVEANTNGSIMLGAGDMYSMAIRLNGNGISGTDVAFDGDVVLDSDVTITAENATFQGTVDSDAGQLHSLTIADGGLFAHADATFNGAVGSNNQLGSITVDRNVTFNETLQVAGDVTAVDGTAMFNAATNIGQNVMAGVDAIFGDDATVGNSVAAGNDVIFGDNAFIGAGVDAGNDATFGDNASVGSNVNAQNVTFGQAATIGGGVQATTGNASFGADAIINGSVMAQNNVTFAGAADVGTSVTAVTGNAIFNGAALVGQNVTAGNNAVFSGTADVGGNVIAGNNANFVGAATVDGDVQAGNNIFFSSTSNIGGGVSATNGEAVFFGAATVGDDVFANQNINFNSTAIVGGSVTSATGSAFFGGNADVGVHVTADQDVTFNNAATVGGNVTAVNGNATFSGPTTVGQNVLAGQNATFGDDATVNNAVAAGNNVSFGNNGSVGAGVQAGNNVTFGHAAQVGSNVQAGNDVTFGDLATVGGTVQATGGNASFGDAATIGSVLAQNNVTFAGAATVDSNVTATAGNAIFGGDAVIGGNVNAGNNVSFNGASTFNGPGNQAVTAGNLLTAAGPMSKTSTGHLTLSGINGISLGGPVAVNAGNLNVLHNLLLSGGSVTTSGNQTYSGNVTLGANTTMSGANVNLTQLLLGGGNNLTVNASGQTNFGGAVSGVGHLLTDAGGTTIFNDTVSASSIQINDALTINGGAVTTTGTQTYTGGVTLGAHTTLAGGNVNINSALAGGGNNLAVNSAGHTNFGGPVNAVANLVTDAGGTTTFGGAVSAGTVTINDALTISGGQVTTTGAQTYNGPVTLGANATLNGSGVNFGGAVGGPFGLTSNAATTFGGAVDIGSLAVNGNTTVNGGLIRTSGNQTYAGTVALGGVDAQIISTGGHIVFQQGIDGAVGLTVAAAGDATFGGNIGANIPLAHFETIVNGTTVFQSSLIQAVGDILLNDQVNLVGVPVFATMGATGDLEIISIDGNFVMGQNQKLTVLGDLTISAANGTATLSDLTTLGDMTVTANAILLLARAPGGVQNQLNVMEFDLGLDFVAGGLFFFSVAPQVIGFGPSPQFSNPQGDGDALGTLGGFIMRAFSSPISPEMLQRSDGTFFDLRAQGPPNTDLSRALAAAAPDESELEEVSDEAQLSASDIDLLRSISIPVRVLAAQELIDMIDGRGLYLDGTSSDIVSGPAQVAISRMLSSYVPNVASSYAGLMGTTPGSPDAFMAQEERVRQIRAAFAQAWAGYEAGGPADASAFGAYLAQQVSEDGDHADNAAEALQYLRAMRRLLEDYKTIGMTTAEARHVSMDPLYPSLRPDNMGEDDLRQAVEGLDRY